MTKSWEHRPTLKSWDAMIQRCTNPNTPSYHLYGGRGITVCRAWRTLDGFIADMGLRPAGFTLDRVDVNGNYELSNCRWATRLMQARNRRTNKLVTIEGRTQCMSAWCEEYGIDPQTVFNRMTRSKIPLVDALTTPLQRGKKLKEWKYG